MMDSGKKAKYLSEKPKSLVHLCIKQGKTERGEFMAFLALIMNIRLIRKRIINSYCDCSNISQLPASVITSVGKGLSCYYNLFISMIKKKMPPVIYISDWFGYHCCHYNCGSR